MSKDNGKLRLCTVKGCHCKSGDDGMIHVEDNGRCGFMPKEWATKLIASEDVLHQLGAIADALKAGETVTIESGSVKAVSVIKAVEKADRAVKS